jgi:hypothetical protein
MGIPGILKPLLPAYRLAQRKREYERFLRGQGWSRKEAQAAAAQKFGDGKR